MGCGSEDLRYRQKSICNAVNARCSVKLKTKPFKCRDKCPKVYVGRTRFNEYAVLIKVEVTRSIRYKLLWHSAFHDEGAILCDDARKI